MSVDENRVKAKLYNEFYEEHKDLFDKDRQEFMRQQRKYVEEEYIKVKYKKNENE